MNVGFQFFILTRKNNMVSFMVFVLISFMIPLVMILVTSTLAQAEINPMSNQIKTCPLEPCYHYAIAPNNSTKLEKFHEEFQKEFQIKNISIKQLNDMEQLQQFLLNEGQGHVIYGIYIDETNNFATIYTRDKPQNGIIIDSQLMKSALLRLQIVLQKTVHDNNFTLDFKLIDSNSNFVKQQLMTSQISAFSFIFLFQGMSILSILAKTKDKRIYEYFVVSGLNRIKFFSGIFYYVSIEVVASTFLCGIFFASFKILHQSDVSINLFIPLFLIPSCINYIYAFGYFSFSIINSFNGVIMFFMFVGFLPAYLFTILGIIFQQKQLKFMKILTGVLQFFLPGLASGSMLQNLSLVAQKSQLTKQSFSDYLTYSTSYSYSCITNMLISLGSTLFYTIVSYLLDTYNKFLNHPTQSIKYMFKKQVKQTNDEAQLHIKDLNVTFTKNKWSKKKKQTVQALKQLNLKFNNPKQLVGLVAQNGGGKTTMFRAILGSQRPTSGSVVLNNKTPQEYNYMYFRQIAVVFQENIILQKFSVKDQMKLVMNVMGEKNVDLIQILKQMGLEKCLNQRVDKLSGGQQRRLCIAMSMMRTEPILRIYDEPACGVDIESRRFLWSYLKTKQNCLTLLTTHIMEEAEELCDEVVILKEGDLVAHGSLLYVKQNLSGGYQLIILKENIQEDVRQLLDQKNYHKITVFEKNNKTVVQIPFSEYYLVADVLRSLHDYEAQIICPNLTEVFLKVCEEWNGQQYVEE